jgi:PEP-CTERM motif
MFGGLGATNNPGAAAYTIGDGAVLTYSLGSAPGGYKITNINTYTGWGDSGRINQDYTVSYSTVSAQNTFIPIQTVDYHPGSLGTPQATEVLLSSSTGVIATGVADIQFTFANPVQNDYVGFHELDVIGSAVPEPSSVVALCGLGAMGLLLIARRRRKKA